MTEMLLPEGMIVHFLQYGMTACMKLGVPRDWEKGHLWTGEWSDVTCEECLLGRDCMETFEISPNGKSITCKRCGCTSHNPHDVEHHYCGRCHVFHDDIWPPARQWWVSHPDV